MSAQLEPLYTPQELAAEWKLSPKTIQRMFCDEPGVVVIGEEDRRDGKRQYTTLRIPASVNQKMRARMTR